MGKEDLAVADESRALAIESSQQAVIQKHEGTFSRIAIIHKRLLEDPQMPRKQSTFTLQQIRDELNSEEKAIVMASFEGGQFSALDWFMALQKIAPPTRPRNLNTVRGVEDFLDKFLLSGSKSPQIKAVNE